MVAGLLEGVGGGQRHGGAHAAGQNHSGSVVLNLRGVAEGADDVEDGVAGLKAVEQRGGFADGLHDDSDSARGGIGGLDGEWNALALLMQAKNEELSRLLLAGDARRLNDKLLDIESDGPGFHNPVHECMTPVRSRPGRMRLRTAVRDRRSERSRASAINQPYYSG